MTGALTAPGAGDFTIITNPVPVPEPAGIYGGGMAIVPALAAYGVRWRKDCPILAERLAWTISSRPSEKSEQAESSGVLFWGKKPSGKRSLRAT